MKKMSTLFKVDYHKKGDPGIIHNQVRSENLWVYTEEGVIPTQKFDGTACAVIDKLLYKRYDAKPGKEIPEGAIPCQEPDPISGHHPHWVRISHSNPADKYFFEALASEENILVDGTYELCGPKVGGNKEKLREHKLIKHGNVILDLPIHPSFNTIKDYLSSHDIEGIVFHGKDGKMCKIRKTDFNLKR